MITINLKKAKDITHTKRRFAREIEMKPLDIDATIPAKAAAAEAARVVVRKKYEDLQVAIDGATTIEQLKSVAANIL